MIGETAESGEPTRRDYVRYGGALAAGGAVAGCSDLLGDGPGGKNTTGSAPGAWEVTMEPAGTRTFSEVPETYTVFDRQRVADIVNGDL